MSDRGYSPVDKDARIAELEAALAARDTLIDTLRFQLAQLRRLTFGQSSEKLSLQIEQLEFTLEELEGEAELADIRKVQADQRERAAPIRALPAHLPQAERRIEPEAGTCTCPSCGGALRPLGQDSDEMLDVAPVQWRVIRTVHPKYSCRSCEQIVQAPAPVKAIARGKASFATLAHVVVAKFDHHLPLYRQAEMMAAQGLDIDRSTLAGWAAQAAHLLDPIVSRIREEGIKAGKIHVDDTPVPMLMPGPRADARRSSGQPDCVRRGKTVQARLWPISSMIVPLAHPRRRWPGIASPLTAAESTRKASSRTLPGCYRLMPMQASTSSTGATAFGRSPAARISGARYSRTMLPARRR